ncbi:hypothetical protein DA482_22480 [Pseudomonas fluorescens]|nr:hypothetical protein FIP59_00995 [Pseudomonas fluorescens]
MTGDSDVVTESKMWERACSRIRCVIQHIRRLFHRFREQARSHILIAFHLGVSRHLVNLP